MSSNLSVIIGQELYWWYFNGFSWFLFVKNGFILDGWKNDQDSFGSVEVLASLLYLGVVRWSEKLITSSIKMTVDPKSDIKICPDRENRWKQPKSGKIRYKLPLKSDIFYHLWNFGTLTRKSNLSGTNPSYGSIKTIPIMEGYPWMLTQEIISFSFASSWKMDSPQLIL